MIVVGAAVVGIGLGGFILTRTNWYKIRRYAIDLKQVFDKHKLQEKAEAVQAMGQNANPVLVKKPLRELIDTYKDLIAALEKMKVPASAKAVHADTLTLHRESLSLYQMAFVGGFRQRALMEKQKKLQAMERDVQAKMEKLIPVKKPKEKK